MNAANEQSLELGDCSFSQIAEVYQRLSAMGEPPPIDALVEFAPHLEREIRTRIPMVALLDDAFGAESASNSVNPPAPDVIAGCVLQEEIGRGGMGIVYRANQPELNRDVAIKIIRLNREQPNQPKRFELERHAMARLDHPNIVPAYSFTEDRHYAYLVMKLVKGHGLNKLLDGEGDYKAMVQMTNLKTDWSVLASLAADVASGLQHAHENGLIHRDIKPGNLLLDEDGKVWITDFGLTKMTHCDRMISRTGDMVGTPRYMSPEQIQGVADPRSDIYSLGMTLYEIAAGQAARGKDWKPQQVLEGVLPQVESIRSVNPDIPEDLAFVIMKACKFLPEDRYQSAKEMEIVLRRFVGGRVADRRKKKRKPDAVFRKEFRIKAALAVTGSILFFAGLTFLLMYDGSSPAKPNQASSPEVQFLDMLADSLNHDLDQGYGERLRDKIVASAEALNLPEEEKSELVAEANVLFDQLASREITHKDLGELLDKYKESSLASATRVWRFFPIIQRSGLSQSEKNSAFERMKQFAYLAGKDRLSTSEVSRILNSLTDGRSVKADELKAMSFSDHEIRVWIRRVEDLTDGRLKPGESPTLANEIREIFPDSFREKYERNIQNSDVIDKAALERLIPKNVTPEMLQQLKGRLDEF